MSAEPAYERVLARTEPVGDCWIFTGADNGHGYGYAGRGFVDGKWRAGTTHRIVYEALVGPVPEGMILHHVCENRRCCNPDHLEVTDRPSHVRHHLRGPLCKKGHSMEDALVDVTTGRRRCRICRKASSKASGERRRLRGRF